MEETTTEVALDLLSLIVHVAFGVVIGAVISLALGVAVRFAGRKRPPLKPFSRHLKTPTRFLLILCGAGLGVLIALGWPAHAPTVEWAPMFVHVWTIFLILGGAWVLTGFINAIRDSLVDSRDGAEETGHARRVRTQTQVITRVGVAVVWVLAISGVLLTFEQFRAIGASMLASAGVLSIVAGLAAQSSLANVFAGLQLAFTDALRVGDIVIVDEHWGTIEEITLTYVVVASWDGRRWVVPSTVFISNTFENWTRRDPELLGTVEFDLDWLVPVEAMRIQLQRIVKRSDLWDGRRVSMQVTDATGGQVQVRATVSAATSGDLWDLRCYVREELIGWVQQQAVYALPRTRLEPEVTPAPSMEEREEFVRRTQESWDDERADDTTEPIDVQDLWDDDTEDQPLDDEGHRGWFQAIRDRRAATREVRRHGARGPVPDMDELIASVLRDADDLTPTSRPADDGPPTAEMPKQEITDGRGDSSSPTARMFSGSPEAEELNRRYAGPSKEELREREERARQRREADRDTGERSTVGDDAPAPEERHRGPQSGDAEDAG